MFNLQSLRESQIYLFRFLMFDFWSVKEKDVSLLYDSSFLSFVSNRSCQRLCSLLLM